MYVIFYNRRLINNCSLISFCIKILKWKKYQIINKDKENPSLE